jgi:hypothetical protein
MAIMAIKHEATIKSEPGILERLEWHRMREASSKEVVHPDWTCNFYALHRSGRLDNDQREAGDKYATLVRDYRKLWHDPMADIEVYRRTERLYVPDRVEGNRGAVQDVERALGWVAGAPEESEFEIKRAQRIGKKYKEAMAIAGPARRILEDLLIDDIWPVGWQGQMEISHALTRLYYFFATGTKRERK